MLSAFGSEVSLFCEAKKDLFSVYHHQKVSYDPKTKCQKCENQLEGASGRLEKARKLRATKEDSFI